LTALQETIIIPKTAVLWTGKRAVVYVKQPEFDKPTFQFREIELGTDAGEYYVVNKGLFVGEEIVTNGVFKIDGAAQLQGKVSMMNPAGGKSATGHQHSGEMPMNETDEELK
jgi:Cu(I)/Ag(I) efflux system membrane fusion protein